MVLMFSMRPSNLRMASIASWAVAAAGRMTTEFIALPVTATAHDAIEAMRKFEGRMENMSTIYLTDSHGTLAGAVPLVKIVLAPSSTPLLALAQEPLISCHENAKEK